MRRAVAAAALLIAAFGAPLAEAGDRSAGEWLEQMTRALASLNYDGLFTHTAGNRSETMRIVHRYEDGRSMERLVSLDGSGREIVRTPEEIHFYMPDRRVVLVEQRSDDGSLLRTLPKPGPQLDSVYTLSVQKGTKLLGREVRILDIQPRDNYRYGYRLWLDEKSAMPLRSEVVNGAGVAVEAIHFTRLEVRDRINSRELEPAVDAAGFQWMRAPRRPDARVATAGDWRPRRMPPGFPAGGDPRASHAQFADEDDAPDVLRRRRHGVGVHRARQCRRPDAARVDQRRFRQRFFHAGERLRRHRGRRGSARPPCATSRPRSRRPRRQPAPAQPPKDR